MAKHIVHLRYLHVLDPGMTIDEIACFGRFGSSNRGSFPGSSTHRRHPAGRGPSRMSWTRCFCVAKNPAFQHPWRIHGAAIYGDIYHPYTPNVSIYIPYMDPMGHGTWFSQASTYVKTSYLHNADPVDWGTYRILGVWGTMPQMGFIAGTTLAVVVSGFERYYKRWDKDGMTETHPVAHPCWKWPARLTVG